MPTEVHRASSSDSSDPKPAQEPAASDSRDRAAVDAANVEEIGGPSGPEPTRYGDWERKGRCIDF
jgi:hypothetical protein